MAGAERRLRLKVYLDEGQRVAEIFVTPVTKCRDIVQRLQRQIHETDCFLIEVWQGCERLVPDNESIFSTLLEWGSDLEDVKFYLRPREDIPTYTQAANGSSSQRVNGFKEEPPLSRDVLLGGSTISINGLKEFAAKQQQEIAAKEKELKAKQVQFMEMRRKSQNKPQNPYVQQLSAKADEQDQRLKALRHTQDQVDSYKLSNSALAEELENVRSLFMEKEKELAIAVARVESLTQQLDKQRKGWSQSTPSREKTHQELELERLRKELMTRNELNHQQSVQIQSQKQLLAEKHKELFELDAQIDKYTNDLQQKRSQSNHIDTLNHQVNGSTSPTDEQDFVEMDYSSLSSFTKRPNKTNNADSKNGTGNAPVTSGSFRGRGRNARKLETLLEVEEEVSDGHASNKSSTEDLTQGPGPPRASRVTALKSRFGEEGVTSAKLSNRSSSPARRVEPEGVETPPEMFGLDGLRSVDAVRENRYYNMNDFLDISSLKKRPSRQNGEESNQTLQEETFEVKPEPAPGSSESSTPSDGDDFSGHSSPLSFASSSSVSSNSSTAKAAVFAITGVARQASTFSPPTEPTQPQNSESASPQRGLRELTNAGKYQGLSNANKFETSSAKLEKPSRGVLASERSAGDPPLQARQVKSEGFPTKNEKVGSVTRATLLDFSRTGMRPQRSVEKSTWNNQATSNSAEQKVPSLTEVKAFEAKPKRISGTSTKPALDLKSRSDGEQGSNLTEQKTMDSSVKSGKLPLSRLQYLTATPVNSALPQQHATNNSESQMRLQRNVEDPSLNRNEETPIEDTAKKGVNFSWTTSKGNSMNASLPRLPQNSIKTNGLVQEENSVESMHGFGHSREEQRYERDSNRNDETDSADKTTVDRSLTPPLVFRPISYRAKKLGGGQSNVNTSADRSQLALPTSNSVSIRGQSSSLTKITVTPSASYYTGKNTNIPEQRSPVPTSKRSRFMFRGVVPTSPENDDLGDDTFDEGYEQKHEEFIQNENLDQETAQTNRQQGNKIRNATRSNSKQVVSSVNIQLSSQSKKANQEQDKFSSLEKSTRSYPSDEKYETAGPVASGMKVFAGKELNFESGRLSSESDRLNSEGDRVSPDSGRLHHGSNVLSSEIGQLDYENTRLSSVSDRLSTESGRLTSEGSSDKSLENSPTVLSPVGQTSPTTNGESNTGVHFWKSQAEQAPFIKNMVTSNNEGQKTSGESLLNELSFTRTRLDVNEDDALSERAPGSNRSRKNVETKQGITAEDSPLEITDVNTAKHVAVNREIGPGSQLNNSISDRFLSNTLEASSVKATIDDISNPALVNGDVGLLGNSHENVSSDGTEETVAPAQKTARKKKARHVCLDPHAVLLDAAVEGELDLVKQVVREVDNPSKPNSDGITALHNAVCASHDDVVHFLVEYGVDINSPDSHGWTPLHCAAANNATELARFLIEHGASIFAATSLEKKTPMQCCERGVPGYFNCMKYLNDVQQNFGLLNNGRVYALYSYTADEEDELSFECGEELLVLTRGDATEKEWWWAENKDGETGYIPRNLLGLHARISSV